MSLILDALRKMEQERRSRRGSGQDLRPEVLRYRLAAQPKQPSRYPLFIVAALLLSVGIGAGFWLNGNGDEPERQATQDAGSPGAAPLVTSPAAPAPVPTEAPAALPPAAAPAAPAALPEAPASRPLAVEPARQKTPRTATAPQPATPMEEPGASHGGASDIVISGIAYQDERHMRRAVLNGVLVGEGAEIAGARVVEIKETKVKLSRGGQIFEVPFSSGMQSR